MEDLQVFFNNSDNAKQYSIIPAAVQVTTLTRLFLQIVRTDYFSGGTLLCSNYFWRVPSCQNSENTTKRSSSGRFTTSFTFIVGYAFFKF